MNENNCNPLSNKTSKQIQSIYQEQKLTAVFQFICISFIYTSIYFSPLFINHCSNQINV